MSAIGGATAACAPIGTNVADHCFTAGLAALVAYCGASASISAVAWAAIVLAAVGGSFFLHVLGVALLGILGLTARRGPVAPVVGALIAAAVVQGVLRLPFSSPTYASAAIAAVAIVPILASAWARSEGAGREVVRRAGLAALGFVLLGAAIAGFIAARAHSLLVDAERSARAGVAAAKAGDRSRASSDFALAERSFRSASSLAGAWWTWPARQVPVLAPQVRTIDQVVVIGSRAISLAIAGVNEVDPNRLRLQNGRIDLAALKAYRPIFSRLSTGTERARAQLRDLRTTWLVGPMADALRRFEDTVAKADDSAQTADEAVSLAPQLLGGQGTRRYLILFVTPAELRGSGGLIANYGVLVAQNGRLRLQALGRGPDLDTAGARKKHLDGPKEYLARYGKFDPASTWENVTMSPDFPTVARVAAALFPQSGGTHVDGVVSLDPVALRDLLSLTGPIAIGDPPLRLDADNVVRFLYHDQYVLGVSQDERINLLSDIAQATFARLTHGSGASPSRFANSMSPALQDKNLTMWFADPVEQQFAVRIRGDGAVPAPRGDSFGLVAQNAGANKLDAYMHRQVEYSATVDADSGGEQARATIALRNDAPSSGLPAYVIGNEVGLPTGTNRLILAVYSTLTLRSATLDGNPFPLAGEREFGRNVYSAYVDVPPGKSQTITLDLEGAVDLSRSRYEFDWFSQVMPNADGLDWSVHVEGGAHVVGIATRPAVGVKTQRRVEHVKWGSAPVTWSATVALDHGG